METTRRRGQGRCSLGLPHPIRCEPVPARGPASGHMVHLQAGPAGGTRAQRGRALQCEGSIATPPSPPNRGGGAPPSLQSRVQANRTPTPGRLLSRSPRPRPVQCTTLPAKGGEDHQKPLLCAPTQNEGGRGEGEVSAGSGEGSARSSPLLSGGSRRGRVNPFVPGGPREETLRGLPPPRAQRALPPGPRAPGKRSTSPPSPTLRGEGEELAGK